MKVLGISGSPRKNGNSDLVLNEIISGANNAGAETEIIFLRDYAITPCIGCERCRKDLTCSQFLDGMHLLYPKVEDADILILGSPTYNYNVTSQMKTFIDRLYPYYIFNDDRPRHYSSRLSDRNRTAAVFSVCEQKDPSERGFALEAMARPLEALGYEIREKFPVYGFFDRGLVRGDEAVMKRSYDMGYNLVTPKR
ncbi:MAG TPA: flavodoxin family protein [Methanoregula sp.]|nr:flavodoxin family protein [Methanoregula sp.]